MERVLRRQSGAGVEHTPAGSFFQAGLLRAAGAVSRALHSLRRAAGTALGACAQRARWRLRRRPQPDSPRGQPARLADGGATAAAYLPGTRGRGRGRGDRAGCRVPAHRRPRGLPDGSVLRDGERRAAVRAVRRRELHTLRESLSARSRAGRGRLERRDGPPRAPALPRARSIERRAGRAHRADRLRAARDPAPPAAARWAGAGDRRRGQRVALDPGAAGAATQQRDHRAAHAWLPGGLRHTERRDEHPGERGRRCGGA